MSEDVLSLEYFRETLKNWNREELEIRCYELCKEKRATDIVNEIKSERIQKLMRRLEKRQEKVDKLERENKIIKKYLQLIIDLGFDYDGFNESEDLKKLIDELVRYAVLGRDVNDKEIMYVNDNDKYNILMEKIND